MIQNYRNLVKNADLESVLKAGAQYLKNKPHHRIVFGKDVPDGFK